MTVRRPRTPEQLSKLFYEQVGFLIASADAFDAGQRSEAKRLALHLRVLLHDKGQQKSAAGMVQRKGQPFIDSAVPLEGEVIGGRNGLVFIGQSPAGVRLLPMLDRVPKFKHVTFDEWWNSAVFRDINGETMSRRDLVLCAADQDGGAHVDPTLDERYARFAEGSGLNIYVGPPHDLHLVPGGEAIALRQIAHEALKSLIPGYTREPHFLEGEIIMFAYLVAEPEEDLPEVPTEPLQGP